LAGAVGWLSEAISEFHGLPGKRARRAELRHRLIEIQTSVPDEMSVFSEELDLSDIAERVQKAVEKLGLLDKLLVLADIERSPDPEQLRIPPGK
jgi:hypothetical protein